MFQYLLEKISGWFNIPAIAVKSVFISHKLSGINKKNFPAELIALNTTQLSRGLLNFTFFQHFPGWVMPYWAVKQYDPDSPSFIPRSHYGLSINVTNRNWTAIGNTNCNVEPIVDPVASVTPFKDGWSLEGWIKSAGRILIPSRENNVEQTLEDSLPVINTIIRSEELEFRILSYTSESILVTEYEIQNKSSEDISPELLIALRPFNPEGIGIVKSISSNNKGKSFLINSKQKVYLSETPDEVILSNLEHGDAVKYLNSQKFPFTTNKIECRYGFANLIAGFICKLLPGGKKSIYVYVNLEGQNFNLKKIKTKDTVKEEWNNILLKSIGISIPDLKLSCIIKSALCSSLQFMDSDQITPGPAIYHRFWFRDAAYQLNALDKFGYTGETENNIENFNNYQKRDGYYQSPKGEWDSNGQVIWTLLQHALLSDNIEILKKNLDSLYKAVRWIGRKRIKNERQINGHFFGLMPKGISAEHLGLADYYYWDNFWSLAGVKSFIMICEILDETTKKIYALGLMKEYESRLSELISKEMNEQGKAVIPSAPGKTEDSGMAGTISAVYPLQVLGWDRLNFNDTLDYIRENYFHKDLFFQNIIHSGANPYITLQVAHSYLYIGNRNVFNKILNDVINYASPTLNFPEAIHPLSGGGVIGDGHHGWTAAEIMLAVRDAFVFEKNYYSAETIELNILAGIASNWFFSGNELSIKDARVLSGKISITCMCIKNKLKLAVNYLSNKIYRSEKFVIKLPFSVELRGGGPAQYSIEPGKNETVIFCPAQSLAIEMEINDLN